ncbi:MAG: hypothetical protein ACRD9R_07365 [Pyrinomonadaceae bacterium]
MDDNRKEGDDSGGEGTFVERFLNRYVGDAIHIFLSLLGALILVVAVVATFNLLRHDVPKFFISFEDYKVLSEFIQSILLIAIAAELGLLLLFHRTSSAVEVIIFVIARKMVNPENSATELLLEVAALAGLLVVRFYFLPGRPK